VPMTMPCGALGSVCNYIAERGAAHVNGA